MKFLEILGNLPKNSRNLPVYMLQAILVIGQYAYCPEFLGNTRITRFNRAIRVLPKIFGQYAYCPDKFSRYYHDCPIALIGQSYGKLICKELLLKLGT